MASVLSLWPCARDMAGWGFEDCQTYTDRAAWSEFYLAYLPKAIKRVRFRENVDERLAEDLVQEAFEALWKVVPTFVGGYEQFCQYFWRAVRWRVLTYYRTRSAEQRTLLPLHHLAPVGEEERPDYSLFLMGRETVEQQAIVHQDMEEIGAALRQFPDTVQRLVVLTAVGYEGPELAQRLGLPVGRVEHRVSRARWKLRQMVLDRRYGRKQWSSEYLACVACGTTERQHEANGLCHRCAVRLHKQALRLLRPEPKKQWGPGYAACVDCGTTEQRHRGKGLCERCYGRLRARQLLQRQEAPTGGRWHKDYAACARCGRTDRPHAGKGCCKSCAAVLFKQQKKAQQRLALTAAAGV